jgi:hypothetical protein
MRRHEWRRGTQGCVRYARSHRRKHKVGRTPWSAADAHVGLLLVFVNA